MTKAFREMVEQDALGGILLVGAAVIAMFMANTFISPFYEGTLNLPVSIQIGAFAIAKPLILWINDGLMAIFFFLVGLEVKREILEGHLSSVDQIVLPGIAAVAGIAVPSLIYYFMNAGDPVAANGWAIPAATDIAFALGLFALFGKGLPISLKLFLLSVAIFDDIGAIVIIALFYSQDLSTLSLTVAAAGLVVLFVLNRFKVPYQAAYILVTVVVWAAVLKSGVHATLAGFLAAWFIPINVKTEDGHPMLNQMEHGLQPWVALAILPIFAFANAGVNFSGIGVDDLLNPITLGIALGLFIGKQIGIFGACWMAVKLGIAKLPTGSNWAQLYGVCLLCGIGFTMSLFIGTLAFENQSEAYLNTVKLGVVLGSLMSAVLAAFVLKKCQPQPVSDLANR